VKTLPPRERSLGIALGAGFAVALRIGLTFFAAQLLQVQFVKLAGGVLVLWIAVRLLADAAEEEVHGVRQARSIWQAMWYIVLADITMSTDNILAIAGTSGGNIWLLIFGLGLSIPFVVFTSTLLARIMDRWPVIVWIGAAILGRVGGDMMIGDPWIRQRFDPPHWVEIAVQIFFTVAVLGTGWLLARRVKPEPVA
jgi:YjbE family integral membrane protein